MTQAAHAVPQQVPRGVLIGAGALIAFTLAAVVLGRDLNVGESHMPSEPPVATLRLTFADRMDGGVDVSDASSGALLMGVAPGTGGFLRSAMRGFAHERARDGVSRLPPFTLTRWRDGTLSLADEATGRRIDLDAFGPTQAEAFAQLFTRRNAP